MTGALLRRLGQGQVGCISSVAPGLGFCFDSR
jgi:hypothetical protein